MEKTVFINISGLYFFFFFWGGGGGHITASFTCVLVYEAYKDPHPSTMPQLRCRFAVRLEDHTTTASCFMPKLIENIIKNKD